MIFVRHAQIHDGQHHENERLQRDHQDMEYRPCPLQNTSHQAQCNTGREHQSNKDKDHLTGVHVSEQSQTQRDWLSDQGHRFQEEVHRNEDSLNYRILRVERVQRQFTNEATDALDFDRVEDHQSEYEDRHTQSDVHVSGRYDFHVANAHSAEEGRQYVDRDKVHEVHHEDPGKDSQRERCHQSAAAVEGFLHSVVDELNDHLNKVQHTAWYASVCFLRHAPEQEHDQSAKTERPAQGVNMYCIEAHRSSFITAVCHCPGGFCQLCSGAVFVVTNITCWQFAKGQIGQVVRDILLGVTSHRSLSNLKVYKLAILAEAMCPSCTVMNPANSARTFRGSTRWKMTPKHNAVSTNFQDSPW